MTLPLFSWFKNKKHEVYQETIRSYSLQASLAHQQITSEVASALSLLKKANQARARFEASFPSRKAKLEKAVSDSAAIGLRGLDARRKAEEALTKLGRSRLTVTAFYNEALLNLEKALGIDLADVFAETRSENP